MPKTALVNHRLYNPGYSHCVSDLHDFPLQSKIDEHILKIAGKHAQKGSTLIEIGCNRGEFLNRARHDYQVIGFDINSEAINNPINPNLIQNINYGDVCAGLPLPDSSADIIVTSHVLEHLPDLTAAMREIERILKPGGININIIPCEIPMARGVNTIPLVVKNLNGRQRLKAWKWPQIARKLHLRSFRRRHALFDDEINFEQVKQGTSLQILWNHSKIKFLYYPAYCLTLKKPIN